MMSKKPEVQQQLFYYGSVNDLVPQDHFLRDVVKIIDFSFIYDKVEHLYSPLGRPSIDPVILMKMILIGYIYGIPSERRLEEDIKVNLAYRWFLGLELHDSVPDHSTISQNRRRRFKDSTIFQDLFNEIIFMCINAGLITGETIVTDSTHIKASAANSKGKNKEVEVKCYTQEYLEQLEKEADKYEKSLQKEGKKRGRKSKQNKNEKKLKTTMVSTTDPECGFMNRGNKPKGFHYLAHTSIETELGLITDIYTTPGNVNDHLPYGNRIKYLKETFGFDIKKVGLDSGYDYDSVYYSLDNLEIEGYIPYRNRKNNSKVFPVSDFEYNFEEDYFICPSKKLLKLKFIDGKNHKIYSASTKDCCNCELKSQCISDTQKFRRLDRPFYHHIALKTYERIGTEEYYQVQKHRRVWCEGTFGILKENNNLRTTRFRGIKTVQEQCLFSALASNIKRIVKYWKKNNKAGKLSPA